MPKITFYNLPGEKKERLLQALHQEFSRVPLNEASIANIIKAAGIPRGSFYQYFEDKTDAFLFLLEEVAAAAKTRFYATLKENNGDLFAAFSVFFRAFLNEEGQIQLLQNTFLNMNLQAENVMEGIFKERNGDRSLQEVKDWLGAAYTDLPETDLQHVMDMLVAITFHNIIRKFAGSVPLEEAVAQYERQLALLKFGVFE